jgi:hypothetical protein
VRYEDDFGSFWMVDDNEFVKRRHLSRGRPRKYDPSSSPDIVQNGSNGNTALSHNGDMSNGAQSTINSADLLIGNSTTTASVSGGYNLGTISPAFNTFSSSFNSLLNINTTSNHQQQPLVGQQQQTNYFSSANTFDTQ